MTLNGVMAVTLRYFTEYGKLALQKTICLCIVFLVRVQCRRKESSRSLSHLLMSFLSFNVIELAHHVTTCLTVYFLPMLHHVGCWSSLSADSISQHCWSVWDGPSSCPKPRTLFGDLKCG